MSQEQGLAGRLVGKMIQSNVKKRFHTVHWIPPSFKITPPVIFITNHHGWHDGYLMYHVVKALKLPSVDWIQEFDSFPLFAKVGGMPYPVNDPQARAKTIRQTIRLMLEESKSLILFAEGILHPPHEILPMGKSLALIARQVPNATLIPTAIHYQHALHERPEAYIAFAPPIPHTPNLLDDAHCSLTSLLQTIRSAAQNPDHTTFKTLVQGTHDINERMKPPPWIK